MTNVLTRTLTLLILGNLHPSCLRNIRSPHTPLPPLAQPLCAPNQHSTALLVRNMAGSSSTTTKDSPPKKENEANHLAERLSKDIIDHKQIPDTERCLDLLKDLKGLEVNMALLEATKLGKLLGKATKTLQRHQRTAPEDVKQDLQTVIETSSKLLEQWRKTADKEAKSKSKKKQQPDTDTSREGLPKTQSEYRARLVKHSKEMYKDPPAVPPGKVEIESEKCPAPKRDKKSGELTFVAGEDTGIQLPLKEFHPNRTPEGTKRNRCPIAIKVTLTRH